MINSKIIRFDETEYYSDEIKRNEECSTENQGCDNVEIRC